LRFDLRLLFLQHFNFAHGPHLAFFAATNAMVAFSRAKQGRTYANLRFACGLPVAEAKRSRARANQEPWRFSTSA